MPLLGIRKDQLKPSFLTNATSLVWETGWQMKFFGVPVFIRLAEVDKSKSLHVIFFSRRFYLSPAERCNQSVYTEATHQKAGYFIIDGKMEGFVRNLKTFWSGNRLAAGRVAGLPPVSPWSSQIIFCLFAIFMNLIL